MMRLIKQLVISMSGNRLAQRILERNVFYAQYLMGVGTGISVEKGGEQVVAGKLREVYAGTRTPLCVFDVGANRGQFITMLLRELGSVPVHAHLFEPGRHAFDQLRAGVGDRPGLTLNNTALGRTAEERQLFYHRPGNEMASLYRRQVAHLGVSFDQSERVRVETLDAYCASHAIQVIDLLKLDVEGHEIEVLAGAVQALGRGAVRMLTFEFGPCNIDSRTYFQDFYYLLQEWGLRRIFRMTPSGYLVPLNGYREVDEQFQTMNFLALPDRSGDGR